MEEAPIKFVAKKNCKDYRGSGFLTRTTPMGTERGGRKKDDKKLMSKHKALCHCATEIKEPEPDECVVPKVTNVLSRVTNIIDNSMRIIPPKKVHYASSAIPSCENE